MTRTTAAVLLALSAMQSAAADVPAHACKKPRQLTKMDMGDMGERKRFDRDFVVYKTCMEKYVKENDALAVAHHNAAKAAVAEINAFVAKANAQ